MRGQIVKKSELHPRNRKLLDKSSAILKDVDRLPRAAGLFSLAAGRQQLTADQHASNATNAFGRAKVGIIRTIL